MQRISPLFNRPVIEPEQDIILTNILNSYIAELDRVDSRRVMCEMVCKFLKTHYNLHYRYRKKSGQFIPHRERQYPEFIVG